MFLLIQSLEKGQKYYKDGYMNPGTLKWTPTSNPAKAVTAEITPKVMIRNSTMTQLYPPDKEENGDVWIKTQVVQPFGINAIVTQMFSKKSGQYPLFTTFIPAPSVNDYVINRCQGKTIFDKKTGIAQFTDKTNVERQVDQYNLSLIKNDFPVIFMQGRTGKPEDPEKMKDCTNPVVIPSLNLNFSTYSTWYDNVQSVYRKYWRQEDSTFRGFKRGERIITVVGNTFQFKDTATAQASYNQIMQLIDGGVIDLKKDKFNKFLTEQGVDIENFATQSSFGNVTITANVFQDYDIGLDMWTVALTIVLAILSAWFIITIKCVPKFGKKIYTCCPSLFEVENTEKVAEAVETPKAELVVAQGEEQKTEQPEEKM